MAAIVTSRAVETAVRATIESDGYELSKERGPGETGTDIVALKGGDCLHIEAIAYKRSGPARAKDFFEVFFRAISRLDDGATTCVIALPSLFDRGLKQRAAHAGPAWRRIGDCFPELQVWFVWAAEKVGAIVKLRGAGK
jgi:hypothetical protein